MGKKCFYKVITSGYEVLQRSDDVMSADTR